MKISNIRYKDAVEDQVHELLSTRLHDIHSLFGQVPAVFEDAWVAMALGEKEKGKRIFEALPNEHPFELRHTGVEKADLWVMSNRILSGGGVETVGGGVEIGKAENFGDKVKNLT